MSNPIIVQITAVLESIPKNKMPKDNATIYGLSAGGELYVFSHTAKTWAKIS